MDLTLIKSSYKGALLECDTKNESATFLEYTIQIFYFLILWAQNVNLIKDFGGVPW